MKKLGLLNCGGTHAINCVPPTSRKDNRGVSGSRPVEPVSPRRFSRSGLLDGLSDRERTVFKDGLNGWATNYGRPTERRKEAVERLVKAEEDSASKVDLSGLSLRRLPTQIGMLKKTITLDAKNNEIQRVPKEIGHLHALHNLDLQGNAFSTLPRELGRLTNLIRLNLDRTKLERIPDEIDGMTNLRVFSAAGNSLSQVPASMKNLSNLRELNLKGNQIWQLPDGWNTLFHGLRSLDLSDNRLQALPNTFGQPAKSIELNLANNRDLAILPTKFGGFEYGSRLNDDVLKNGTGKVIVNTRNTAIRKTLVQDGRLQPGRGIVPSDRPFQASARPPAPGQYEPNLGSVYSARDYIQEHGGPGQAIDLEHIGQPYMDEPTADALGPQPAWTKPVDAWLDERARDYGDRFGAPLAPPPAPVPQPTYTPNWGAWPHVGVPGLTGLGAPSAAPRQLGPNAPAAVPPNLDVHALASMLMQLSAMSQPSSSAPTAANPMFAHGAGTSAPFTSMPTQLPIPAGSTARRPPNTEQPWRSPPPWARAEQAQSSTTQPARDAWTRPDWVTPEPAAEIQPELGAMPSWVAGTPPATDEPEPETSPYWTPEAYGGIHAPYDVQDYDRFRWGSPSRAESDVVATEPSGAMGLFEQMMSIFREED